MTMPKFLSPVLVDIDGWHRAILANGHVQAGYRDHTATLLAMRGQRPKGGVWPEGFGVVEIEDIPKPAPLPTAYYLRHGRSGLTTWDKSAESHGWTLVATITFDEAGNPHREDHQ